MKILKVIHGYPPSYNAGSENYSQILCNELESRRHSVQVFTRVENPFMKRDFQIQQTQDPLNPNIQIHLINNSFSKDRYRVAEIDLKFAQCLKDFKPDVVHIGHLNHLSTSLIERVKQLGIPIIYTLHDYWLMCPRGQFLQRVYKDTPLCNGQEDQKCAERCYSKYFSGDEDSRESDVNYWTTWVKGRMQHVNAMVKLVDHFIAPSRYLYERFTQDFGIPEHKISFLDYGFESSRLQHRKREGGGPFTFGYIGTHIPAKGIQLIIKATEYLKGETTIKIWGKPRPDTAMLKQLQKTPAKSSKIRIEWISEYKNEHIVNSVFNHCDAIIVPSIWVENSPLVIHEAQQVRLPVIATNLGGMKEFVRHNVNGLLFDYGSSISLAEQMQRLIDEPSLAIKLGKHGYLYSTTGDVVDISKHVDDVEKIYSQYTSVEE